MRHITATTRITIGLVCLSLSVWLLATTLGLIPDRRSAVMQGRANLCESIAMSCSLLATARETKKIEHQLKALVSRNPDILGISLQQHDGQVAIAAGQVTAKGRKNDSQAHVPILVGEQEWGLVQIDFKPSRRAGLLGWLGHPIILLLIFLFCASYLVFFYYLRKMLQHLDPSKVIPDRVRTTLDTLAEGLLVIDANERIVMANKAFADGVGRETRDLMGSKASSLPWEPLPGLSDVEQYPWLRAIRDEETQVGAIMTLRMNNDLKRTLKINASPIRADGSKCRGAFVSFDDVTQIEKNREEMSQMLSKLSKSRDEIRRQNVELERLATLDPLTSCLNRRSFFERFESNWKQAQRHGVPLSVVLLDIDFFKDINDNHGHSTGDLVLQRLSAELRTAARDEDVVCRYGGEEFIILLPNLDIGQAAQAAERYRELVAAIQLPNLSITASFGVSSMSLGANSPQKMLDESDKALYCSKRNGRNCVTRWDKVPDDLEVDESKISRTQDENESPNTDQIHAFGNQENDFDESIPFNAVTALTSALAYRDESTAEHSRRVADLCVGMASDLMSVADAYVLEVAALLHDIGKIGVPDAILLKPGPLTKDEWKVMGVHDRMGVEILSSTFASPTLLEIVESHHAFFGGKGRNEDLPTGEDIPLSARILSIADAFDAMTSDRVYRKGMSHEEAFAELRRCVGTQFDPELVEKFIEMVGQSDTRRTDTDVVVSKETALRIGEQMERLIQALDEQNVTALAALAGRLNATATKQGVAEIAEASARLQAAACRTDEDETVRLTAELLELCRSTQKVHLDCIAVDETS